MTNEELIAKIKAEVERLENYYTSVEWYVEALLSFLSTLEEQPKEVRNPIFDKCVANVDPEVMEEVRGNIELEEEYKDYVESDPVYSKLVNRNAGLSIARHFAQWGAEHKQKNEQFPPLEGLDAIKAKYYDDGFKNGFDEGVVEGKRLMMEEAVEGEYDQYPAAIYLPAPIPRMNKGDKVKIIIVKED